MPNPKTSEKSAYLDRDEHISKGDVGTKKVTVYYYDSGTDELKPINSTNPLPVSATIDTTGLATSAKQDTIIGHVDGIETLIGTTNTKLDTVITNTDAALTDTELRATPVPVSGTVTATPTGTQNVDVTANTIGLSTSANQTNGTQQTKLTDGTNTVAVGSLGDGDGSRQSLVVDGRMRMYNGTSFDRIRGNTTDGLLVNLGANNDVTVTSGAITETNSAAIKAAVETIDNAISGSEMQVDVVGALPAGTNAIGKLSANSGVDIGDVDVTSSVTSTLDHGSNRDIDTSAEQITSTSFACKFGVTLKADITNTGIIYVGNSDVTAGTTAGTDGFPLSAGETITLEVNNPNLLYAIASANNQIIYWIAN